MGIWKNLFTTRRPSPRLLLEELEGRVLLSAVWQGQDYDGDAITVTLAGEGSMVITQPAQNPPGNTQGILKIELADTEGCDTVLTIAVKRGSGDGLVNVGRITGGANSGLHLLNAPQANIVGTATVVPNAPDGDGSGYGIDLQGYLRNAVLHDVRNGADIWAKQPGIWYANCAPTTLVINDIDDNTNITLGSRLEKFTLNSWGEGGTLDVKSIGTMAVKGSFGASVTTLREVGPVTIGGALNGSVASPSTWNIPRSIGVMKAGSVGPNFAANVTGNVAALSVTGDMAFSSWSSKTLGSLSVMGKMTGGTFTLTQPVDPQNAKLLALGATGITGAVSGAWNIAGHTAAITVGATLPGFDASIAGNVPSFTVNGAMNFHDWSSNTLGKLSVKTTMTSTGTMRLTQGVTAGKLDLGSATVGGWMTNVSLRSAGNIGAVTALAMSGCNIFAGVKDSVTGLLGSSSAGDYLSADATIGSVTIKGIPGSIPSLRHSMYTTDIIASHVGKLAFFGPINSGGPNGVAARTIASLGMQKPDGTKFAWSNPVTSNWPFDASSRIDVRLLT